MHNGNALHPRKSCPHCGKDIAGTRATCGASPCRQRAAVLWLTARRAAYAARPTPTMRDGMTRTFRLTIFERDEWICHICRYTIDPSETYPSLWSAVVDHVTPLALGGGNEVSNLRAAHSYCNSAKGNRTLADLGFA